MGQPDADTGADVAWAARAGADVIECVACVGATRLRFYSVVVELRYLRYFVAVAEEQNFSRAAHRLQMAQPPLSAQIRQLEDEIGDRLFERTTRRVELTPAGVAFLERARSVLGMIDAGVEHARRAARGEVGRLRVGFTGSATYELLPALARRFREHCPDVVLELSGEMLTPARWRRCSRTSSTLPSCAHRCMRPGSRCRCCGGNL